MRQPIPLPILELLSDLLDERDLTVECDNQSDNSVLVIAFRLGSLYLQHNALGVTAISLEVHIRKWPLKHHLENLSLSKLVFKALRFLVVFWCNFRQVVIINLRGFLEASTLHLGWHLLDRGNVSGGRGHERGLDSTSLIQCVRLVVALRIVVDVLLGSSWLVCRRGACGGACHGFVEVPWVLRHQPALIVILGTFTSQVISHCAELIEKEDPALTLILAIFEHRRRALLAGERFVLGSIEQLLH